MKLLPRTTSGSTASDSTSVDSVSKEYDDAASAATSPTEFAYIKLRQLDRAGTTDKAARNAVIDEVKARFPKDEDWQASAICINAFGTMLEMAKSFDFSKATVIATEGGSELQDAFEGSTILSVTVNRMPLALCILGDSDNPMNRLLVDVPHAATEVVGIMPFDHSFFFCPVPRELLQKLQPALASAKGDAALLSEADQAFRAIIG